MNKATTEKAKNVKRYQKNCPQTLRAYVQSFGYSVDDWTFDELAEEWGLGYIMYWEAQRMALA